MFLFGKLIIEHFGNDEFIKIKSFTRLVAAMKISAIGKTTFLRVFRKWKQDGYRTRVRIRRLLSYFSL